MARLPSPLRRVWSPLAARLGAAEVAAAGGVVRRPGAQDPEYLLIHRPKYRDWSLPKGKLDQGETFEQAALREVEEETGLRCRLGVPAGCVRYRDPRGRRKIVRYWTMEPLGGDFTPNREVDEIAWVPLPQALERLSHERDRDLLESAVRRPL